MTKLQLCEHENQTMEAFVAASRLYAKWPISFPGPSNFLRRMLNENEGSAKVQFLGNPVWLSEMQYSTISPIFADY